MSVESCAVVLRRQHGPLFSVSSSRRLTDESQRVAGGRESNAVNPSARRRHVLAADGVEGQAFSPWTRFGPEYRKLVSLAPRKMA